MQWHKIKALIENIIRITCDWLLLYAHGSIFFIRLERDHEDIKNKSIGRINKIKKRNRVNYKWKKI